MLLSLLVYATNLSFICCFRPSDRKNAINCVCVCVIVYIMKCDIILHGTRIAARVTEIEIHWYYPLCWFLVALAACITEESFVLIYSSCLMCIVNSQRKRLLLSRPPRKPHTNQSLRIRPFHRVRRLQCLR